MRKPGVRGILTLFVAVAIAAYMAISLLSGPQSIQLPNPPTEFSVNGRTFLITYIATSADAWQSGLMNKKVLNSTTMLFVFPSYSTQSFWMKGVNSSLDIVWLNVTGRVGTVVSIAMEVPPCGSPISCPDYSPSAPYNWALEMKGGVAEASGVVPGTTVRFS